MSLPIRTRLTLWYAAVLAMIIVAIAVFLVWRLRSDLIGGLDRSLETRAEQTTLALEDPQEPHEPLDVEDIGSADVPGLATDGSITQVISSTGRVLGSAGGVDTPLLRGDRARSLRDPLATTRTVAGDEYRILAVRLERSGAVLVVGTSTQSVHDAVGRLIGLLAVAIPVAIVISALGGYLLAGRALRPIDRMTRTAAAIGADDSAARLEAPAVDDEVGRLGTTLNEMLDRLHAALTEQRRFTADASHELRTPLAIMQTEIDVALRSPQTPDEARPVLASVAEELERTQHIVSSLLTLARADEDRLATVFEPVDLREIARSVRDRLAAQAATRRSQLKLEVGSDDVMVSGDEATLDLLLSNLVDNAIRHGGDSANIAIRIAADDGFVVAEVSDDGPGIPTADLPHIFDRFHRVDKARTRSAGGAGLGLAISRAIAQAHSGEIDARSSAGEGSVFMVRLPPLADL